ncbi:MAG TPA: carboxymuconolactone decarboxylase family protein [Methylomirabilota bacterium]|jgi:4-carboxymuconolactone decarboxylase|nr:carboxymuconolactone decarboxylase family protein [Methylomirabilota bacterium]
MAESETYQKGQAMRRRLLGDAFVDRASRTVYSDPIMRKFIDVGTETIFGSLWTRPGLDLKTRTLVTVVSDAATGREAELAIHLRMALRQGWTEEELTEALIHLVGYVGAPLVRDALLVARELFAEVKKEAAG